jgi:hypothetical protein
MQIQQQRLDYLDDFLMACGWIRESAGWLPPEQMRGALALEVGPGHLKRSLALAAQVQADEFIVRSNAELSRPVKRSGTGSA